MKKTVKIQKCIQTIKTKAIESVKKFKQIKGWKSWVLYTVIWSILPFLIAIGYDRWLGYNFSLDNIEYLSDVALIVVAIAATLRSNVNKANGQSNMDKPKSFSVFCLFIGIALYSFVFRRKPEEFNPSVTKHVFRVILVLLLCETVIGFWVENKTDRELIDENEE